MLDFYRMKGGGAMRRRNWMPAALLTAAVMLVTALAARAEPATTIPDDPTDIPVAGTTVPETTAPDMSITVTTTGEPTEPPTTVDYDATDEYGSTIHEPTTTTTKGPTTTTKKTRATEAPFQVNPAHPEDTYDGPVGWRDLPNWYVVVTDQYGNEVTRPEEETTTEATTATEEESSEPEEDLTEFPPEEAEEPTIRWTMVLGAGAVLLAALAGVIIMLARGRRGEDDYLYEDAQQ